MRLPRVGVSSSERDDGLVAPTLGTNRHHGH
jgi:hypothetical protein